MKRFFFYGTLLAGSGGGVSTRVHAMLRPLGPAMVRGRLHAIRDPHGWYPALVPGTGGVVGAVYEALPGFAHADLARMDAYEDFDPARPNVSLYRRIAVKVAMDDGAALQALAYVFNRPLPRDSRRIADGDFRKWLADTGHRAYGG